MIKCGLTGDMGSGKTFIAGLFRSQGIPTYITDIEIKRLQNSNQFLKHRIIKLLGEEAYLEGKINSHWVASKVFQDEILLKQLSDIVGPFLLEDLGIFFSFFSDKPMVLVESAILFEVGLDKLVDQVILVEASLEIRQKRALQRDGITIENYQKRMNRQWPIEDKRKRAHYVIENNDESDRLIEVKEIINKICNII